MRRRQILIGGAALAAAGAGAEALRMGSMSNYDAAARASRAPLAAGAPPVEWVRYAALAANGHNTQPWKFSIGDGRIDILPDLSRRTPVVDPDDHHLFASLGCAAENLAIAAATMGRPGEVAFDAASGAVSFVHAAGKPAPSPLFESIPRRQSARAAYDGQPLSAAVMKQLARAAAVPGVEVVLLTERAAIDRVRDLIVAGNDVQMNDRAFVRELKHWLRFSPRQAAAKGDGLFSAASANPALPDWAGPILFDLFTTAKSERDKYARHLDSSAGVAVFVAETADHEHWMRAGRAAQRFALQVTALGLSCAFVNQPVEVARFRPELASLVGLPGRRPDLVLRFGKGPTLTWSPRRPVSAVLASPAEAWAHGRRRAD